MTRWFSVIWFLLLMSPLLVIGALRWLPPPTTSYMLQSQVQPVQHRWVPAGQIAEVARRAVVASEDQKFWTHDGFDREAIQKAYINNQKSKHHKRGASTISQQTAKNLFLWPGGGYFRKGVEAVITVLIEHLWTKQRILEMYLNIVEFGPGVYGIEAASQTYLGKSAAQLSPADAARLAAVLPNPRHWSARSPGPYVQLRSNWILGQMGYGRPVADEPEPEPPLETVPGATGGEAVNPESQGSDESIEVVPAPARTSEPPSEPTPSPAQ